MQLGMITFTKTLIIYIDLLWNGVELVASNQNLHFLIEPQKSHFHMTDEKIKSLYLIFQILDKNHKKFIINK